MITGVCGIDGVADAFAALGSPEDHVKILVEPGGPAAVTAVSTVSRSALEVRLQRFEALLVDLLEQREHRLGFDVDRPRDVRSGPGGRDGDRRFVVVDGRRPDAMRVHEHALRVVAPHEPLADLHAAHLDRADVAVDGAALDAGHPRREAAEVAGDRPHVVRAARDVDLADARWPLVLLARGAVSLARRTRRRPWP